MVQKFRKACEANGWVALGLTTFKNSESKEHEAGLGKLWDFHEREFGENGLF